MNRFLLILLLFGQTLLGQNDQKITALNNYVDFTNDCIHGMTIAHLMLQSFNNEVNAYVDATESFTFKNSDFGQDIYSDLSYYEHRGMSPKEFYPIVLKKGAVLGAKSKVLNELVSKIFSSAKKLNDLRFETGDYIASHDLKQKSNLKASYAKLEEAAKLFNDIYVYRNTLELELKSLPQGNGSDEQQYTYKKLHEAYFSSTNVLKNLRAKKTADLKGLLLLQLRSLDPLNDIKIDPQWMKTIIANANKAHNKASKFVADGSVPKSQIRYGKFYYYYNDIITSSINIVGSGVSFSSNRFFKENNFDFVHFLDMPPMFKVLYPKKLKSPDLIESSDNLIEELPVALKERKISLQAEKMLVDKEVLVLELFDHLLLDGDKVSVNFNGDWILENQSLEEKPIKLKLKLNREGKNYIIIHAVDEGIVEKVTVGFSYFLNGKKQKQLLKADLDTSKLIEIITK